MANDADRARTFGVVLAIPLVVAFATFAQDAPPPDLKARVAALLVRLDSDDFQTREAAATAIEGLPAEALPMIEAALARGALSPEVSFRLEAKAAFLRRRAQATAYEKGLAGEQDWSRRTFVAAYDAGGHTDAKWDAAAREALVLAVRPRFDPNRSPTDDARILAALQKAVDLGCDDPFFLYVHALRYRAKADADPARAAAMMVGAADGVLAGPYPAYRKLMAAARRAEAVARAEGAALSPGARREVLRDVDVALGLLPAALKDAPPRPALLDGATVLHANLARASDDAVGAIEKVAAALRAAVAAAGPAAGANATAPAAFEAGAYLDLVTALNGTTDAYSRRLPADMRNRQLRDATARAKAALDAWTAADRDDPIAYNQTLRYLDATAAPAHDYEACFAQAMAAYPNNLAACQLKCYHLRRVAGPDELLAFGRECLAGGNWASRIPFVLMDCHYELAGTSAPERYFQSEGVWDECKAVHEGYLSRYPNATFDRTMYARAACWCGQWAAAKRQFDLLGDDGAYPVFKGKQTYDYFRRKAERLAKE